MSENTYAKTDNDTTNKSNKILDDNAKCDAQRGIDLLRLFRDATGQSTCGMLIFVKVCYVLAQDATKDAQSKDSRQIFCRSGEGR